jgi:hypothetical protein
MQQPMNHLILQVFIFCIPPLPPFQQKTRLQVPIRMGYQLTEWQ